MDVSVETYFKYSLITSS
uniref:Uncharacterized protein n=1 Tax=Anguilla anguilla TaxID=7936 RepID=A0A0E9UFX8_ANGAN